MIASGRENAMSDSVYKVIEVVGTSSKSWEAVARYDAAPDVVPPDAGDVLAAIVRAFPAAPSAIAST
jgi:Dodecin